MRNTLTEFPYYEGIKIESTPQYKQVAYITSRGDEEIEEVEEKEARNIYRIIVTKICKEPEDYEDQMTELNDDKIILKKLYNDLQRHMKELVAKQKIENNSQLDLLLFNK